MFLMVAIAVVEKGRGRVYAFAGGCDVFMGESLK